MSNIMTYRQQEIAKLVMTDKDTIGLMKVATGGNKKAMNLLMSKAIQHINDYNLEECEANSIIMCTLACDKIGLSTLKATNKLYLMPFKNKKKGITEAQVQVGAYGFAELAVRNGAVHCNAFDIREGEYLGIDKKTREHNFDVVEDRENKKIIGFGAYYKSNMGLEKTTYMTTKEMYNHASKFSQSFKYTKGGIPPFEKID